MGCDIFTYVEQQVDGAWRLVEWEPRDRYNVGPFDDRCYAWFGFLAGVRDEGIPPLSQPRGLPEDVSDGFRREYGEGNLFPSWLGVDELLGHDYDAEIDYEGERVSYRKVLGETFMLDLEQLRSIHAVAPTRVVFWFDN